MKLVRGRGITFNWKEDRHPLLEERISDLRAPKSKKGSFETHQRDWGKSLQGLT